MAEKDEKLRQIKAAIKLFPKIVKEKKKAHRRKEKILKQFEPFSRELDKMIREAEAAPKAHPWRLCPIGQHWVKTHPFKVEPTETHPQGQTIRHGHCAKNPNRGKGKKSAPIHDYLAPFEMNEIAKAQFGQLSGPPTAGKLKFKNGDKFDDLIRGWTKYWNDVFQPADPLDPNLVKALIASESSFVPKPKDQKAKGAGNARGLIQLTDQAIKALGDMHGELKDHYVEISKADAYDPNLSIAAGVRWLFQKKAWASGKLGREASWIEAIAAYKGYLPGIISGKTPAPTGMMRVENYYRELNS